MLCGSQSYIVSISDFYWELYSHADNIARQILIGSKCNAEFSIAVGFPQGFYLKPEPEDLPVAAETHCEAVAMADPQTRDWRAQAAHGLR